MHHLKTAIDDWRRDHASTAEPPAPRGGPQFVVDNRQYPTL
jgi:hypothetical protein